MAMQKCSKSFQPIFLSKVQITAGLCCLPAPNVCQISYYSIQTVKNDRSSGCQSFGIHNCVNTNLSTSTARLSLLINHTGESVLPTLCIKAPLKFVTLSFSCFFHPNSRAQIGYKCVKHINIV